MVMSNFTLYRPKFGSYQGVYTSLEAAQSAAIQALAGHCYVVNKGLGFLAHDSNQRNGSPLDISIVPVIAKYRHRWRIIETNEHSEWGDDESALRSEVRHILNERGLDLIPMEQTPNPNQVWDKKLSPHAMAIVERDIIGYFTADGHKVE
jgi:hypothetical protein